MCILFRTSLTLVPNVLNIRQMTLRVCHTVLDCLNDRRSKEVPACYVYVGAEKWHINCRDFEAIEESIIVDSVHLEHLNLCLRAV